MTKQFLVYALVAAFATGCATAEPTLDTSPDAEVTFDGLVPVKNSAFKRAWADPDVEPQRLYEDHAGSAEFEFRAVRKTTRRGQARISASSGSATGTNKARASR